MKIRKFMALPITRSALATSILIIPMLYDVYDNIDFKIKIGSILIVILINVFLVNQEIKMPIIKIEEMLEVLIRSICLSIQHDIGDYRANIMLFDSNTNMLEMKYHFNMMGSNEWGLKADPKSSCSGDAFTLRKSVWVDLIGDPTGGYSSDERQRSEVIKSILSVPILNTNNGESIGVLNVDCKLDLGKSGFSFPSIRETANTYAYIISKIL